jgi:hypothetical protein
LGLHETPGGEALHRLDDLEVRDVEFLMFGRVIVLFGYKNTLCNRKKSVSVKKFMGKM